MSNTTDTASSDRSRRVKFWGVAIVLLMMVLMIFSSNPLSGRGAGGGRSSPTIGTTRDGVLTADDRASALRMLDTLETVYVVSGGQPLGPLPEMCWGADVVAAFRREPEALHLALVASRRIGPGTSPLTLGSIDPDDRSTQELGVFNNGIVFVDQLHPLPSSRLAMQSRRGAPLATLQAVVRGTRLPVPITSLSTAEQRIFYDALNDFLAIQSASSVTASAMKVSDPVVDRVIAEQYQKMTVRLASFDAVAQLGDVPQPSEAQLAEHFAKFADATPGVATKANPFGFGYRVPDRVRVEWIALDHAAVRAAVEAEKTPHEWDVETRIAFAKDPAPFASLAPASQPTTAATAPATSQPAFEQIKASAIRVNIDRAADARLSEIERRIRALMTNDYQAWTAARTTSATTAPTTVGVPIEAADYLDRIAATIARQFKITPKVERLTDELRDVPSLAIASATFASLQHSGAGIDRLTGMRSTEAAPTYAIRAASTQPAADRSAAEETLATFQPSQTVTDRGDSVRAIFRVTEAAPSRPAADVASVHDRAVDDWRIAQAQAIALKKAAAEAEAVRSNRPSNLEWKTVTLDFTPQSTATLGLTQDAVGQLRDAANELLLGGAASARPSAALDVPLARRAYAAQRTQLAPVWQTPEELAALREQGRAFLADQMLEPESTLNPYGLTPYSLNGTWLNVAKIYERAGWSPSRQTSN